MEKRILTIQDISCVGQCSLTVALPIISACGIETAILPTAVLSTHTAGFKGFTVLPMTDDLSAAVSLAAMLRAGGLRVQLYSEKKKFKAKIGYADKLGIPFVFTPATF